MNCRVKSVSISWGLIGPHVINSRRITPSAEDRGGAPAFQLWSDDDPEEHTDDNQDPHMCGSFRAVAVDILDESRWKLDVEIDISGTDLLNEKLQLCGDNDAAVDVIRPVLTPLEFREMGRNHLSVEVRPPWVQREVPWGLAGNITWRLRKVGDQRWIGLNSTRLEFYALRHPLPLPFFGNTVQVELLRKVLLPQRMWRPSDTWEKYCCRLAFQDFAFKYDTINGRSSYYKRAINGKEVGEFKLGAYLKGIGKEGRVNCYDQAAALQVFLPLSPTIAEVEYMFMRPFGFIHTTVLVGRGACNNPFYGPKEKAKIVLRRSDERTRFGNHAFVRFRRRDDTNHKIVDACCGPHMGDEDLNGYLTESIDHKINSKWAEVPGVNGTAANARIGVGVKKLSML
ncbi:hypothetical protein O1611_g5917 [Lasiodiplodia mahajangana]|uniref:Uncharacterized protein n=1 Tax=Lasiodiplodia mahajangana TaxID=1108764 RepID=A0ACC2JK70_9PEZI|nr:hypothetical protein O1611_g5917 [Lasiodiplodia mahajangana]